MQIPDEVTFEASAFESDNDAYRYVAVWARKEALDQVRAVRAQHPACTAHPEDDPVTCGWKRTVLDIDAVLADGDIE